MEPIASTVRAEFPDRDTMERFAAWIIDGHAADVIAGGAQTASLEQPGSDENDALAAHALEVRYVFPSREAFVRYEREYAPVLREQGKAKFPTSSGVRFTRRTAVIRWLSEHSSARPPSG